MNETHIDPASQLAAVTIEVKDCYDPLNEIQRRNFDKKVDRSAGPDACWPWLGGKDKDGYGRFRFSGEKRGAHKAAYLAHHGSLQKQLLVCHSCDNPPCCNPAHLFLGTALDNSRDMVAKNRQATGDDCGVRKHPGTRPRGDDHHLRRRPELIKRGECHPRSILSESDVISIRSQFEAGGVSTRQIAKERNVSRGAIEGIVSRRTWRCIP